jgi:two-component system LytT family response regulator
VVWNCLIFFEEKEVNFSIIFTTAYNQYAIQAFKLAAVDYLLKPIESGELKQSVERFKKNREQKDYAVLRQNMVPGSAKKIAIPTVNSIKFIETDKITHLRADGAYTHIHLEDHTKLTTSKSLKTLEGMLSGFEHFFRCHKSYIVNIHFVNEYIKSDGGSLLVNGNEEVQLSSEKSTELLDLMARM